MKLTFWGAARQVTGSMHLLTLDNGYKILVDCGLNYEQKKFLTEDAFSFPFNPVDIDLVVLTHAHIDHSGNLPALVHHGFQGQILCTAATADLTKFLLFDSANIQWQEYKQKLSKAGKSRKRNFVSKPIYTEKNVQQTLEKFVTIDFAKRFQINASTSIEFIEAGHLLGAASVVVEVKNDKGVKRIGFTGDLGRSYAELIRIPIAMQKLDYLITETTYGSRKHKSSENSEAELMKFIEETCVRLKGRLIIPAFSVGRTQAIVYSLNKLEKKGLLPPVKVFVDSPLAVKTTHVYSRYNELLNAEATQFLNEHGSLFDFDNLFWIDNLDGHDELMNYKDSCIIVSAAGMVEGGRIQEHVKNNIQNPFSTILIAGYCSEGTLGHRLLQGQKTIGIKGRDYQIYSTIAHTDVFSSHPDKDEIFNYIKACENDSLKKVFLVHGDMVNLEAMKETLEKRGYKADVEIPELGDEYKL
jgi:metallo-beta-lactamase family protein